uniref:Transmembrane protein 70 n=1 Tax=Leptobrachium leishanense TaxID=445787 RepID=A0A8C5ME25_9ANUR
MLRLASYGRIPLLSALRSNARPYVTWQPCCAFLCVLRPHQRRDHVTPAQGTFPCTTSFRFANTTSFPENAENGRLVYIGNLSRAVLSVKFFSYSTSMFAIFMMPYIMLKSGFSVDSLALKVAFCSIAGFFTFVTPVTLHLITKGYVVRLYHSRDKDTYTAVTYNVFLAEKRTVFSQKDVKVPGISKMFTTFYAGKKSMLVNPSLFPNPQDYSHLMGYDKPFTFNPDELDQRSKDE